MLEIDKPLQDMITAALDEIRAWVAACGGAWFSFDDINWDAPTAIPEDAEVPVPVLLKASHAIGFICGVSAGLDVTPLSLLWAIGIDTETAIMASVKPAPPPTTDRRRAKRAHSPTVQAKPVPARRARVKLTDKLGNERYIYRSGSNWRCASRDGIPLAMSYAGIRNEMECSFALDDCKTADEVLAVVQKFSTGHTAELVS